MVDNQMPNRVIVWDIETIPDLRGFAVANGHDGKRGRATTKGPGPPKGSPSMSPRLHRCGFPILTPLQPSRTRLTSSGAEYQSQGIANPWISPSAKFRIG